MDYKQEFDNWMDNSFDYPEIYDELLKIKNNEFEIRERFCNSLKFGTAGVRGKLGVGTNRINNLNILKISIGVSNWLKSKFSKSSVVIAYDTRKNSYEFAKISAKVFSYNSIKTYLFKDFAPTPLVSYAVRELNCTAGVIITASHNTCEYNGYKLFGSDGAQICNIDDISLKIENVDVFKELEEYGSINFDDSSIEYVDDSLIKKYLDNILKSIDNTVDVNVTYSPLNGCGRYFFTEIAKKLKMILNIVKCQEFPDDSFASCPYPNPEVYETYHHAIELALLKKSDLIILNDPDGDRVGVAVYHKNEFVILNGNDLGALILNYLITNKRKENQNIVIKSLVSGGLVEKMAKEYNLTLIEVLPGFKFMGQFLSKLEKENSLDRFLFAFEESQGYLFDINVRDKDGIFSAALICEMVSFYKEKNMTLINILESFYEKYGFYLNKNINLKSTEDNIFKIFNSFKNFILNKYKEIKGYYDLRESFYLDLKTSAKRNILFPKSDMLLFCLEQEDEIDNKIILRFSGTEPIIKFYIHIYSKIKKQAESKIKEIEKDVIFFTENM